MNRMVLLLLEWFKGLIQLGHMCMDDFKLGWSDSVVMVVPCSVHNFENTSHCQV